MNSSALCGLALMVVSECATLAHVEPFWSWNTPIAWTGFILFADGIVWRTRGDSWIRSSPREFALLSASSVLLWLVFEFYNRFLRNWYYVGLPESTALRDFGYIWSFSTIWPAIFEGADLVSSLRNRHARPLLAASSRAAARPRIPPAILLVSMAAGAAMLVAPFVTSAGVARYLAAPVWLGFIFLLDPINRWLGESSLFSDVASGSYNRIANLLLSGLLCGVLWEFWNYWARTKWHYTVPIMEHAKLFEMPLPGYLGFPAFALECFTMYTFIRATARLRGRSIGL